MHDDGQNINDTRTFVRDIYTIFFFRAFKAPPAIWKFTRSWFHALFKPGSLNPREDCGPENRYLNDVRLSETLFSLALASAVGNFMLQGLDGIFDKGDPGWLVHIIKYFIAYLQNAYLLWLFSSILVASIFSGRWWIRFTKADILPRREVATLFIYEAAVLILPLIAIMFFSEYQLYEPLTPELLNALIGYAIFAVTHLLIFFFRLGTRAGLPIWKRVLTSFFLAYLAVFAWVPGLLITLPFYFLPLLLFLYPLYALIRDFVPKPVIVRRFFKKIQSVIEI